MTASATKFSTYKTHMFLTIIIAFVSLIGLIIAHELGHFMFAKKFGVKVEEFGVGYPPRLFGKKIGETVYSLNLLPFGAFVKIYGEEGEKSSVSLSEPEEEKRSFQNKPIYQRMLIILGGVISFWIISIVLLSFVMALGAPTAISDTDNGNLKDVKVQIAAVSLDSPADKSGIKPGDAIISVNELKIDKVVEIQEFTQSHKGEEILLTIERGKEIFNVSLVPRVNPPEGEGAIGVSLVRTAMKSYPWWQAIWQGISATFNLTIGVVQGWEKAITNAIEGTPSGVQVMGPIGIFSLFNQSSQLGVNYFLQFIALISVYLALFNILPIPALDGGKLLFLTIEAVRKKPVSLRLEQKITAVFFTLLIMMMVWATIKDITRLF